MTPITPVPPIPLCQGAGDAGDWISTGNTANDAFDAFLFSGTNYTLSSLDSTVLNAIGLSATCFLEGTRIETSDRERTVEALIVGGRLPSLFKGFGQVVWIGKREIELSRHPAPAMVRPVRIRAGAFGTGRPFRDLYLSPDHAVLVDGVLIQVKRLFNGNSIQPIMTDGFVYYHIELETHDIIRAEGLPVETYLDAGDRSTFANGPVTAVYPDFAARQWEMKGCAPLISSGPVLDAVRLHLSAPELQGPEWPAARASG